MFGFRSQRSKEEEKAGIQFLASMLVCYPEISSLSYDPRPATLTYQLKVRGASPARAHTTDMFHVERDVMTLERDELTLIARLFTERFGKALLVDEHSLQKLEEDFATVQSELLDQMLDQVQRREFRFRMHMVGLRENDRVVVYNR